MTKIRDTDAVAEAELQAMREAEKVRQDAKKAAEEAAAAAHEARCLRATGCFSV